LTELPEDEISTRRESPTHWWAQRAESKSQELDFDTRFGMLVDAEHLARDNKRIVRALRVAKLRLPNACIEDIDFAPRAGPKGPTRRKMRAANRSAMLASSIVGANAGIVEAPSERCDGGSPWRAFAGRARRPAQARQPEDRAAEWDPRAGSGTQTCRHLRTTPSRKHWVASLHYNLPDSDVGVLAIEGWGGGVLTCR
jgi:hypothetical protein